MWPFLVLFIEFFLFIPLVVVIFVLFLVGGKGGHTLAEAAECSVLIKQITTMT